MSSSISSSEPARWRRFARWLLDCALFGCAVVYGFVVLVDPWDTLPLSPPLNRAPVSSNARFSFPALARSARFDAAIFGTSTSRLLRPDMLDGLFGARFANLAMNSATAWEQYRLFQVFLAAHPQPAAIIFGLDDEWCENARLRRLTDRPFPEWMYSGSRWAAYRQMFTLYAVQEAGKQFGVLTGLRSLPYGRDGYANFLPDDSHYDAARAQRTIMAAPLQDGGPAPAGMRFDFPSHALLREMVAALPAETLKLAVFLPYNRRLHPVPGSVNDARWQACKRSVAEVMAGRPRALLLDFAIPSPITLDDTNYWDPHHYRVFIAERLMAELAAAARGEAAPNPDFRVLVP